jgi:hypothetical protein
MVLYFQPVQAWVYRLLSHYYCLWQTAVEILILLCVFCCRVSVLGFQAPLYRITALCCEDRDSALVWDMQPAVFKSVSN